MDRAGSSYSLLFASSLAVLTVVLLAAKSRRKETAPDSIAETKSDTPVQGKPPSPSPGPEVTLQQQDAASQSVVTVEELKPVPPTPIARTSSSMVHITVKAPEPISLGDLTSAFKAIRGGLGVREENLEEYEPIQEPVSALTRAVELLVSRETDVVRDITLEELGAAKVVRFVDCARSSFVLPVELIALIKVFIEDCSDVKLSVECKLLTRHIEIARCERLEVQVRTRADTVQVDLSKDVRIFCDKNSCRKVFHAGVEQLQVCSEDSQTCVVHDFLLPDDPAALILGSGPSPEHQFVTEIIGDSIKTYRVKYKNGGLVPSRMLDMCYIDEIDQEES